MSISINNLKDIALGTTILGSGGGGDPECDRKLASYFIETYGEPLLIDIDEVADDALIVPVGFMGAPSVCKEMLSNGSEFDAIFTKIEERFQKKIGAIVASEIGGSNGIVPISVGAKNRLPVVDADTLARAFPELQMSSCTLCNIKPAPCFIADSLGRLCIIEEGTAQDIENKARIICQEMGSSAAVSFNIMTKAEAKQALIAGTLTLAKELGLLASIKNKKALSEQYGLTSLAKGRVIDIESRNDRGFLEGKIVIEGGLEVLYQNEYLIAKQAGTTLAVTPDIICLFEEERFIPLCVENVRFGIEVELASMPSAPIWKTPEGLALVGPKAFGYEV